MVTREVQKEPSEQVKRKNVTKLSLGIVFFVMLSVVSLMMMHTERASFLSTSGGMFLFSAGFVAIGLAMLPRLLAGAQPGDPMGVLSWVLLGLGLTMWVFSPIVMRAGGIEWTESLGTSGRRNAPLWMMAVFLWGSAAAVVWGVVAMFLKKRRASRVDGSPTDA